ncbi:claudin-8-like [Ammospiza caudacuta]|uniref:claudin-8-like n=1 Tax=Ammospiza caudacuta TaxID=2857398 RepID=UPI0027387D80|nr:claudin-8-like [Ammospiza caudacuta]
MSCCVLQITGLIFGAVGMLGTLAATAMPQWRVSAHVEANLVVFESVWEGLWMDCVSQLGLRLQCKLYDSVLALPPPLEALRALMCLAVLLAVVAFLVAIVGVKYSQPSKERPQKVSPFILVAGVAFLLAGGLALVPVSWAGGGIVRDFYDPAVPVPLKRELGAALYVGWASSALLLAAGAMYCHSQQHLHGLELQHSQLKALEPAFGCHALLSRARAGVKLPWGSVLTAQAEPSASLRCWERAGDTARAAARSPKHPDPRAGSGGSPLWGCPRTSPEPRLCRHGFVPSFLRLGSWNVVVFVSYEQLQRLMVLARPALA